LGMKPGAKTGLKPANAAVLYHGAAKGWLTPTLRVYAIRNGSSKSTGPRKGTEIST